MLRLFYIIQLLSTFIINNSWASCIYGDSTRFLSIYNGYIEKDIIGFNDKTKMRRLPISMILDFDGRDIVNGLYSYEESTSYIVLKGKIIENGNAIELEEFNEGGIAVARFTGTCVENNISGKWHRLGTDIEWSFMLKHEHAISGTLTDRYSNAGVTDDEVIHKAVAKLKKAVKDHNPEIVAEMVMYPIMLTIDGKHKKKYNKDAFLKVYDKVFTDAFKLQIANASGRNLFCRYEGVMLGGGEIWFSADGGIIAINN